MYLEVFCQLVLFLCLGRNDNICRVVDFNDLPQGGMEIFQSDDAQYLDKIKNSLIQVSAVWKEPQTNHNIFTTMLYRRNGDKVA